MRNIHKKTVWYGSKAPVELTDQQRSILKSVGFTQFLKNIS